MSDIDTAAADSLKVLDPERPIREADIMIVVSDNKKEPIFALVYSKRQDKPDGLVLDPKRSGKWTTSFWDFNFDDTFPLKGVHPDGKLMPSTYVQRCAEGHKPVKDFKCA